MNTLWFFLLAIPIGLGIGYFLNKGSADALTSIADKYHGRVSSGGISGPTELIIPYQGLDLHVIPYINTRRSRIGDPSIQAVLKLDTPHLPELSLKRYSPVLWKKNSEDPIPTGDEEFDRLFVVYASDPLTVKKVLTDSIRGQLKNEMLQQTAFYMEPDKFVMSGYQDSLNHDAYETFTDAALAVLDQAWS